MASSGLRDGNDLRVSRLKIHFRKVINGQHTLTSSRDAKLFIESICIQQDPVQCIETLISSMEGSKAVAQALSAGSSPEYLNGSPTDLLRYIQDSTLRLIGGGLFLSRFVLVLVEPPIFWHAFVTAYKAGHLSTEAVRCFAWLLLQLVSLPAAKARPYCSFVRDEALLDGFLISFDSDTRTTAHKIKNVLETLVRPSLVHGSDVPGGRHDNDHEDIREITILPTIDELASKDAPFLRRAADVEECLEAEHLSVHIDHHFRLLREDMVRDLREELQMAQGTKKGRRKGLEIKQLQLQGIYHDDRRPWALRLLCSGNLPRMPKENYDKRKKFLKDNHQFLSHGSLACLFADDEPVALVTISRNEDLLAESPPVVCVTLSGSEATFQRVLLQLRLAHHIRLIQLNTAVFAYEPVLRQLQATKQLMLRDEIVHWDASKPLSVIEPRQSRRYEKLLELLKNDPTADLQSILKLPTSTRLDEAQARCFLAGVTQRLSLVQGPPGTGKSFLGALVAKAIYTFSKQKVLVVCYTNHALDQFLDDLKKVGISAECIVRLGSSNKTSLTNKSLLLSAQGGIHRITRSDWDVINERQKEASVHGERLKNAFATFQAKAASKGDILEYLEFSSDDAKFCTAFEIPSDEDGMTRVDKSGRAVNQFYLLDRWATGQDAGIFAQHIEFQSSPIWRMNSTERKQALKRWKTHIMQDRISTVYECGEKLNEAVADATVLLGEKDRRTMQEKRIIACTTTGAAKYVRSIQSAMPEVLLVEEAGEILESHILTALGPETKQAILIGDHKQLRPKSHYDLSVEKGDGYDLNRSLFERLVLKGYPHHALSQQHRMRPEVSALVRHLTYPDLTDAPSTSNRPALRGFQDHLIFLDHAVPEEEAHEVPDWKDPTSPASKKNRFEADMTLKCIRYLAQQGYGTDKLVVLTPYVAQLRLLMDVLGQENDPILNDLDSHDLVRAGLMPAAAARQLKRPLRISSIDNYQGEESDIVVVSLTRSNASGEIGFLAQAERLNVLLSRARDALIMIGNADTFLKSRKGGELWQRFLGILRDNFHIYDGFPVQCERHPSRKAVLRRPEDFENCPDGGCDEPCKSILKCGLHACPQRCHQISDHSKMDCFHVLTSKCPVGHVQSWKCHAIRPSNCKACERKRLNDEKKQREAFERQQKQEEEERQHAAKIAAIDEQIRALHDAERDRQKSQELTRALEMKIRDLENTKKRVLNAKQIPSQPLVDPKPTVNSPPYPATAVDATCSDRREPYEVGAEPTPRTTQSAAELEWERLKRIDNVTNDSLDSLMKMTGLEHVKEQFLTVKARVDTVKRQGIDLKKERYGVVLLGNPGTGKTTVARLYASFLCSLDVIPGADFVETTGSSLANAGVSGAKKYVETILNAGGGAFFIDEAYQLVMGHNYGGKAVLDYLLAEIENQVGKIVFIFAGYTKQMEDFFEHNPGLESRMPYRLKFADYTDEELLLMLTRMIGKKYANRMKVEQGLTGLFTRIVVRRVGRGRGREGFGNARALENVLAKIAECQAARLRRERTAGTQSDDFLFTKEDLIGPEPTAAVTASSAWKEMQSLVGLAAVKNAVRSFLDRITVNYHRELQEKPLVEVSLNRVFVGSPGTGKTTVGKLYGQILADLGLLSSAEVVLKNPADFTGSALGQSEEKTKAILKATEGKVLIIDEAYMLNSGGNLGQAADIYKIAIVDTLVAEVQSTPGEDRCVLLLGYEEQMRDMFRNTNPGLSRRFPLAEAFHFEDFDDDELRHILDLKLQKQGLDATPEAKDTCINVLGKARRRLNFGNAGEVENMISHAKDSFQLRQSSLPSTQRSVDILFQPQDFDAEFDREKDAASNLKDLFKDIVGSESVITKFEGYVRTVAGMRSRGKNPEEQIPFNFIFKGPPGTGKTTTARKIGKVYYDMGFLSSTEVHEVSATDLIAGFVGQTGLKTVQVLDEALGAVLFIDEAYRLGEGQFATEAVNTLVDSLTKPKYMGKMLVVLAGYEGQMNDLLKVNPGLSSRFPEEIVFQNMLPANCFKLLKQLLEEAGIAVEETDDEHATFQIIGKFHELSCLSAWGNGRDVGTLSKTISRAAFQTISDDPNEQLTVSLAQLDIHLASFLHERRARETSTSLPYHHKRGTEPVACDLSQGNPPQIETTTHSTSSTIANEVEDVPPPYETLDDPPENHLRDPGVSDAVWAQLQLDAAMQERLSDQVEARTEIATHAAEAADLLATVSAAKLAHTAEQLAADAEAEELKRRYEQMRLEALAARLAKEQHDAELDRARKEAELQKKQQARAQQKLRSMGICPAGYHWIKQADGYRCSAGGHFVSNSQLGFD